MFASHLIAAAHQVFNSGSHPCCLCGAPAIQEKTAYLKKTFTNWDVLQFPQSEYICDACAFCLSPLGRRHSFVCTENLFISMKREDISKYLFSPPRQPFIFCVTTSFKKYLWLHAKINANMAEYHIRFDDCDVWYRPSEHRKMFQAVEILYQYFTKEEIRRGDYRLINIEKLENVSLFERHENIIKSYRGSGIFELSLHAANPVRDLILDRDLISEVSNWANRKEDVEWKTKQTLSQMFVPCAHQSINSQGRCRVQRTKQKKDEQLSLF